MVKMFWTWFAGSLYLTMRENYVMKSDDYWEKSENFSHDLRVHNQKRIVNTLNGIGKILLIIRKELERRMHNDARVRSTLWVKRQQQPTG